jgi:hypothetical protein
MKKYKFQFHGYYPISVVSMMFTNTGAKKYFTLSHDFPGYYLCIKAVSVKITVI